MSTPTEEKREVYLEADKDIPGQHFVCLSFLSPEKVLANKDIFLFSEFLKDYEIQYKIKATETFMMSQVNKLQSALGTAVETLERLGKETTAITVEDLSGAMIALKDARKAISADVPKDLEAHVKAEMNDFKATTIQEAYETYLYKNRKKLEETFFAKNGFRTTIRGLKVRGVYDTYAEGMARAKTLQKLDPDFNVYVGQVGFWLPWDPEPSEVPDQEYADDQLNQLMKKYKENESQRDEFYESMKRDRIGAAKPRTAPPTFGAAAEAPSGIFGEEDPFMKRKREAAASNSSASSSSASSSSASSSSASSSNSAATSSTLSVE
jgi:uncharacterized protein YqgV (UPF0045/DUF77 family)